MVHGPMGGTKGFIAVQFAAREGLLIAVQSIESVASMHHLDLSRKRFEAFDNRSPHPPSSLKLLSRRTCEAGRSRIASAGNIKRSVWCRPLPVLIRAISLLIR